MARGTVISFFSSHPTSAIFATSISTLSANQLKTGVISFFLRRPGSGRFYCKCSEKNRVRVPPEYNEAFAKRMSLAALKPHYNIAMGVSGGADSMALCALMSHWKTSAKEAAFDSSGYVDGLLAIIVDHGFRPESEEEAQTVSRWVSDMGIRCEVATCEWPDGRPKVGRLEEEGRDMRYQIFQDICFRNQIGILLTAHHGDDQAELFILRLSRNSGVLGLAGMAFTTELFSKFPHFVGEPSSNQGILLVRPLLEFSKEDLYKICETDNQKWVEDPSNRSSMFARNRIRMALQDLRTCAFRSELQALISACRLTRLYVDHICQALLNQAVTIIPHGYAVIDLECLNPSVREDICLSRFLALVLQFISQRHRPVRGSALKLLLDYIRTFPCKTSLTAAGCYLCAAPGTKGTKVLVCCSVQSVLPLNLELCATYPGQGLKQCIPFEVKHVVIDQKCQSEKVVVNASHVPFLDAVSSDAVLVESKRIKLLSKSTCDAITELQMKEKQLFKSKTAVIPSSESEKKVEPSPRTRELFQPGQSCYFMQRFFLTWTSSHESSTFSNFSRDATRSQQHNCSLCVAGDMVAYIRHMIDEDWLYLAKLLESKDSHKFEQVKVLSSIMEQGDNISLSSDYARSSAQQALTVLKSIPVAARRGLPVIVSTEGIILSIPSIGFKQCPLVLVSAHFWPRVPLGGGHSLFT